MPVRLPDRQSYWPSQCILGYLIDRLTSRVFDRIPEHLSALWLTDLFIFQNARLSDSLPICMTFRLDACWNNRLTECLSVCLADSQTTYITAWFSTWRLIKCLTEYLTNGYLITQVHRWGYHKLTALLGWPRRVLMTWTCKEHNYFHWYQYTSSLELWYPALGLR
jgi:hypothetical protein